MPIPVKLSEIVMAMDLISEDWSVHLNPRTGELLERALYDGDRRAGRS